MPLSDEFLQELKMRNAIESVASPYVTLKRRGRNMVGLCPFHTEKTPSFTLYPDNGSFYCFGCGTGGDMIRFAMLIENLDYIEAVRLLASRVGMAMPEDGADDGLLRLKSRILEINREAARYFHRCLMSATGREGYEYLHKRGISDKLIRQFGLGFSPNSWDVLVNHLKSKGFLEEELIHSGTVARNRRGGIYASFRGRVMFPIFDMRGNVIAFGARKMPDVEGPKYINSADTPVYKKSHQVYGLQLAKNHCAEQAILCEGYMDVIALHQAGFQNAVAPLGTSFTLGQARLLSRYTSEVALTLDADVAGQKATERAIAILNEAGLKVRVVQIPNGKDPDDFIRHHREEGSSRFRALLDGAGNDVEYRLYKLAADFDLRTDDGRAGFLIKASEMLAGLSSAIEKDIYAGRLAGQHNVSKAVILAQIKEFENKIRRTRVKKEAREAVARPPLDRINPDRGRFFRAANAEEALLALLMKNPDFFEEIDQRIQPDDFVTAFNKKIYEVFRKRLKNGRSIDVTLLYGEFTEEELGKIVEIDAKGEGRANTPAEYVRYIEIIREEKAKRDAAQTSQMSDQAFEKYMKKLVQKKVGGVSDAEKE